MMTSLQILAARMEEIMMIVENETEILDSTVQHVMKQAPKVLVWKRLFVDGEFTCCFDAASSEGDLYSVNFLTGTVLFNGLPPSRLPYSILDHSLYLRTFQTRNFEVILTADGKLQTIRTTGGFHYRFFFTSFERLVIQEAKVRQDDHEAKLCRDENLFELLDGTLGQVQSWGIDLPIRLQIMHSHWYKLFQANKMK